MGQKLEVQGKDPGPGPHPQLESPRFQTIKSNPTVTYSDVKVDYAALSRLGILPDFLGSAESLNTATVNSEKTAESVKGASVSVKPLTKKKNTGNQIATNGSFTLASIVEIGEDDWRQL